MATAASSSRPGLCHWLGWLLARAWSALASLVRRELRSLDEASLRLRVGSLESRVAELADLLAGERQTVRLRDSELAVYRQELELLQAVAVRDLKRVEAETRVEAQRIAALEVAKRHMVGGGS